MTIRCVFGRVAMVGLLAFSVSQAAYGANGAAIDEVLKLKNAKVPENTVIAYIQGKNLDYGLSADDVLALRDKGVATGILNAMLASGGVPAAQPRPTQVTPPPIQTAPAPSPSSVPLPLISPVPAVIPVAPEAQPLANPDVAYFYQELSPYGRWIRTEDGQWCWQPSSAIGSSDWRPYYDKGHWVWTDHGWYWASDYSWGWAAFHYGRWQLHPHHGWIWYPDRVWGPSWVVWRSGGEFCGWAPLPPGAVFDSVGGHFDFRGRRVEAGFDFGLLDAHFSFCFLREMGQPFRHSFRKPAEFRDAFRGTTIINQYSVKRVVVSGETHVQVFNHGIEPSRIPPARGRSFEPLRIEELHTPPPGRGHEHVDSGRGTLEVYRPKFSGHR